MTSTSRLDILRLLPASSLFLWPQTTFHSTPAHPCPPYLISFRAALRLLHHCPPLLPHTIVPLNTAGTCHPYGMEPFHMSLVCGSVSAACRCSAMAPAQTEPFCKPLISPTPWIAFPFLGVHP